MPPPSWVMYDQKGRDIKLLNNFFKLLETVYIIQHIKFNIYFNIIRKKNNYIGNCSELT